MSVVSRKHVSLCWKEETHRQQVVHGGHVVPLDIIPHEETALREPDAIESFLQLWNILYRRSHGVDLTGCIAVESGSPFVVHRSPGRRCYGMNVNSWKHILDILYETGDPVRVDCVAESMPDDKRSALGMRRCGTIDDREHVLQLRYALGCWKS